LYYYWDQLRSFLSSGSTRRGTGTIRHVLLYIDMLISTCTSCSEKSLDCGGYQILVNMDPLDVLYFSF